MHDGWNQDGQLPIGNHASLKGISKKKGISKIPKLFGSYHFLERTIDYEPQALGAEHSFYFFAVDEHGRSRTYTQRFCFCHGSLHWSFVLEGQAGLKRGNVRS